MFLRLSLPGFPFQEHTHAFLPSQARLLQTLTVPMRLATRGAVGGCSSSRANPQACLQSPLFADFSVSPQQLLLGSLRSLWLLLPSEPAAALPRVSCCCFSPKPFLVSLSPALISILSKSKKTITVLYLIVGLIGPSISIENSLHGASLRDIYICVCVCACVYSACNL